MNKEYIKAKLAELPHEPGSYQMKDKFGEIIYVGKAKDLHNRVNQYFVGAHDFKTTKMVSNIDDFDFIVTASEKEALVLEINLIKKYRPKYNIQFIDDSSYPYIKLTKEKYPRLLMARDTKKDKKARYFGPFPDVTAAKNTLRVLQNLYPFRRCTIMPKKVCLYYHLGQCLGPCEFDIKPKVYEEMSEGVQRFLNGDTKEVEENLQVKMLEAAQNMRYEQAQEYKVMLESIHSIVRNQQNIEKDNRGDRDVFAYVVDRGYIAIAGFLVRRGTILNKEFRLRPLYGDAQEAFESFLIRYYQEHPAARELVLSKDMDVQALKEVLDIPIFQPRRGYKVRLVDMCLHNAKQQLDLKFNAVNRQDSMREQAVNDLSKLAGKEMNRVELFDNSHTSGAFTVAACVVYEDGKEDRKSYRKFKLHTKNSDVDSMKEVLYRRYFRLLKEGSRLPDGILVDGGWGQIEAAKEILGQLDLLDKINIMGLVKDDHHNTRAIMDSNGKELDVAKDSALFFLLTRMQDEVHRAAISYHRQLRLKAQTKSILDEIEGIGPKRKKLLLKSFGNFTNLKQSTLEDIEQVIPSEPARLLYENLHEKEDD
ncbi:excinuclease ABC subunit UvrC [Bulleidia sp. zg-1006]|uniref:excinuclease ABC subunit UvrC n=1 Tax=Bulleidia sp. zg-1006 TaxID=2806552 RepID=UPI001939DEE2|nr:excinuclease ABC subunit UvrC [Bulleidia sp. zg-1006]QRG87414.1 excinuclease ABC subunit UvrC [Bulleidia sp. zg-1006]